MAAVVESSHTSHSRLYRWLRSWQVGLHLFLTDSRPYWIRAVFLCPFAVPQVFGAIPPGEPASGVPVLYTLRGRHPVGLCDGRSTAHRSLWERHSDFVRDRSLVDRCDLV